MSSLRRAAELAEEHLAGIGERHVGAIASYEDTVAALDEPLPAQGEDPVAVIERLAAVAGPATVASPGAALLRVRHRRGAARRAGGRLAHVGVGSERLHPHELAGRRRDRGRHRALGAGGARACLPMPPSGSRPARRWRTSPASPPPVTPCSRRAGWDVEADGLIGAPADPRARGRAGPRVAPRRTALRRPRRAAGGADRGRRPGRDARRRARTGACRGRGTGDRLCSGRRGQHRRLRPARGDRRPLRTSTGRGCTSTAPSACGRPRARGCGTWCDGAELADSWAVDAHKWLNVPYDGALAIVADREAVRAAMGVRASYLPSDRRPRAVRLRAGVVAPRTGDARLRGAALARPRRTGRAGRALLRARPPAGGRDGGARRRCRCSTTSCSTRCSCASTTTTRRPAR